MHALSFYMLTSIWNDHLNHDHLYKISNYIFLMTLSICCRFVHKETAWTSVIFFLEYIPWCEKNSLMEIKKKMEGVIIYSLSYLVNGQQIFSLSFFIGHLWICCCFSYACTYIYLDIYIYFLIFKQERNEQMSICSRQWWRLMPLSFYKYMDRYIHIFMRINLIINREGDEI